MAIFKKIFGDENAKLLKALEPEVKIINELEESIKPISDAALKEKTEEFRMSLNKGKTLEEILPEAYAVVREAAKRTLGERHYDVQLMGGIVLNNGAIAEMRTGEGKTLMATLAVYLNALEGKGAHVITVNDYLSRRDAVWVGQIYALLGLSVGAINGEQNSFLYDPTHQSESVEDKEMDEKRDELGSFKIVYEFLKPCTRKEAYAADITYGTNNEFGFDYLRDNTAYREENVVQRGYNFAIVDEVDSILIDEARTPLIISAPTRESDNLYSKFSDIAGRLKETEHYEIDEKRRAITLTDEGIEKVEDILGIQNIYTDAGIKYVHHLETAVRAKALFKREKEYVVREGEVVIVDEFTGRLMPGRRWSDGLHQAIEAKEGVSINKEQRTMASITFQNYFRMYKKLSGMTGTAATNAEEFYKVYGIETVVIPTNKEIIRVDNDDFIFRTEKGKFKAIARRVKELVEKGQPVLIGTASIEKNELLSEYLSKENVEHEILNAKNHEKEGEIIAQAGVRKRVTVATNMAGRGVDVKLGGIPTTEEKHKEIVELGGLFVIGTERHEARRIDNQLRGRSGRQGDPGETQFFVSMEDSLMRVFASDVVKNMMEKMKIPEDEPIENKMITKSLESAQKKIEGFNFDARKYVLEYDDILNTQRQTVYTRRRTVLLGEQGDVKTLLDEIIGEDEEEMDVIKEKIESIGEDMFYEAVRQIILRAIDSFWVEHLELMDYTRSSVNLRAYGQRDPLVEYKKEGLRLFREMEEAFKDYVKRYIPAIGAQTAQREEKEGAKEHAKIVLGGGSDTSSKGPIIAKKGPGRNDPCPCGALNPATGEIYKYKKCGLIEAAHHLG